MRTHIQNLIAKNVAEDLIYASVETPDGDTEEWEVTFKDTQKVKIEITKTA